MNGLRLAVLLALLLAPQALAQPSGQCPGDLPAFLEGQSGNDCTSTSQAGCQRGCNFVNNCRTPEVSEPSIEVEEQPDGTFTARLRTSVRVPWNAWAGSNNPNGTAEAVWYAAGSIPSCTQSATVATCSYTATDNFDTWIEFSGLTCEGTPYDLGTYSLRIKTCQQPCCGGPFGENCICATDTWKDVEGIPFTVTAGTLGCPEPPPEKCNGDSSCMSCFGGGVGGSGGPPGIGGAGGGDLGPGAKLRYAGDGAGVTGLPGAVAWRETLGRGWSHSYAQKIVPIPGDAEDAVWMISEHATFRKFSSPDASGVYQTAWPADEYRTLTDTGTGWELRDLRGTVHAYDSFGNWISSTDRNGNAKTATYSGNRLTEVAFPDGRTEEFTYHPAGTSAEGKLAAITEIGIDGTTTRTWSLTWSGDDLTRLDRPDGTAYVFTYGDARFPGYVTLQQLEGTDASLRVVRGWEYSEDGNVSRTWTGTTSPDDPAVLDLQTFTWTNPQEPTEVQATDPFGQTTTYQIDRHVSGGKTRVTQISGDCPTCGLGPNTQLTYGDPDHPLRVTLETDGRGIQTLHTYDAHGQRTSRTEAFGTTEERTTTWTYDPDFPALVTSEETPSVVGGASVRRTEWTRGPSGNAIRTTISGVENGSAFLLDTDQTFTAAGQPETVDAPGHGPADLVTYAYDATRGGLLVSTRTDPLIGDTTYDYDPFNRRTSETDPNDIERTTVFDDLDRVTEIREKGATAAEDLVTTHEYTAFGDLLRTTLPRGNVIEYGYDFAGRLVTVERKPDSSTPGERTRWTLDEIGRRVREDREAWDAGAEEWVSVSATASEYLTRCHLDRRIEAPGTPEEAVTEFDFDCNGNLSAEWDANHEGAATPTRSFTYDALDRVTAVTSPWGGAGGGSITTSYSYDVQDHLVSVIDGEGNVTAYTYSDRDLLTQEDSPASGVTNHTYTPSGELATTTDARGIVTAYSHDALDRVTFVDYPDNILDITYTYDDGAVAFSQGRLTAITRNGSSVLYEFDRFGRTLREGVLTYTHDANGNRTVVGYPGGVTATYTHDFADREETLSVTTPAGTTNLVITSSYLPSGPLASLHLGNGLTETRTYDDRYAPTGYAVSGPTERSWNYTTDRVGNILEIIEQAGCSEPALLLENQTVTGTETVTHCASIEAGNGYAVESPGDVTFQATGSVVLSDGFSVGVGARFTAVSEPAPDPIVRTYAYQGVQYFLTQGDGPWGNLAWSYDGIGNRLTETKDGLTDTYSYGQNASGGNSPVLASIDLGVVGTRTFTHGPAGHLEQISTSPSVGTSLGYDDSGRLSDLTDLGSTEQTDMLYDGRSYLTSAVGSSAAVSPVYSSSGLLHSLVRPAESVHVLHFAGRPVGQVTVDGPGDESFLYYTTDHLGTPSLATDETGDAVWSGGFEPFGKDWQEATAEGASENGVDLRLPGQWISQTWNSTAPSIDLSHNVHRWYMPQTGAFVKPDPLDINDTGDQVFAYARNQPLLYVDPLGLIAQICCRLLGNVVAGTVMRQRHCYVVADAGTVYGLYPEDAGGQTLGVPRVYDPRDAGGTCEDCELPPSCTTEGDQDRCLESEYRSYPIGQYRTLGPNSNTFAGTLARGCCDGGIPSGLDNSPGLHDSPPQDSGLRPIPTKRSP